MQPVLRLAPYRAIDMILRFHTSSSRVHYNISPQYRCRIFPHILLEMAMKAKDEKEAVKRLEGAIALYPDFPKKGILFRDIMPILGEPELFDLLVSLLAQRVRHLEFDRILGIESRGFLLGPILAHRLKVPFGPIRKKGKLPGDLYSVEYELEYGKDVLQVQKNGLPKGSRCLIIDDLIATGGSLGASKNLVEMSGSEVVACLVIIELVALNGRSKLGTTDTISLFSY